MHVAVSARCQDALTTPPTLLSRSSLMLLSADCVIAINLGTNAHIGDTQLQSGFN